MQSIICAKDELSALLGSFNRYGGSGGDQAFWLQVFGGRPERFDRVKNGDQGIDIPFMAVSLIGGIQPDKVNTHLLEGDNDGFAARPLYAWPDPVRSQRPAEFPDHGALLAALQKLRNVKFHDGASYE